MGQHYVAFVQHRRLSSWIIRAVEPVVGGNLDVGERGDHAAKAQEDYERLAGDAQAAVWPWAYAAGDTPIARSIKEGAVLWVFGRMRALDREWPPSLVARMEIAEVHDGPENWPKWREHAGEGKYPGFPFANAHRFYAAAETSRFYPYNNAVGMLLGLTYRNGKRLVDDPDRPLPTLDDAVDAWNQASTTDEGKSRFRTIRGVDESSGQLIEDYASTLLAKSVFMSYRWTDCEDLDTASLSQHRLRRLAERLAEESLSVWLDQLMIPPSNLKDRQGDPVLEKILHDGIANTGLLVALVTKHYGGPSYSQERTLEPGYTAIEWGDAADTMRARWNIAPCDHECRLNGPVAAEWGPDDTAKEVAAAARNLLPVARSE